MRWNRSSCSWCRHHLTNGLTKQDQCAFKFSPSIDRLAYYFPWFWYHKPWQSHHNNQLQGVQDILDESPSTLHLILLRIDIQGTLGFLPWSNILNLYFASGNHKNHNRLRTSLYILDSSKLKWHASFCYVQLRNAIRVELSQAKFPEFLQSCLHSICSPQTFLRQHSGQSYVP